MRLLSAVAVAAVATHAIHHHSHHHTHLPHGHGLHRLHAIAASIADERAAQLHHAAPEAAISHEIDKQFAHVKHLEHNVVKSMDKLEERVLINKDLPKLANVADAEDHVHASVATEKTNEHIKVKHHNIKILAPLSPQEKVHREAVKHKAAALAKARAAKQTVEEAKARLDKILKAQKKIDPHLLPKKPKHDPKVHEVEPAKGAAAVAKKTEKVVEHEPHDTPKKQHPAPKKLESKVVEHHAKKVAAVVASKKLSSPGVHTSSKMAHVNVLGEKESKWQTLFGGLTTARPGDSATYAKQLMTATAPFLALVVVALLWAATFFTCCCCRSPCPFLCRSRSKGLNARSVSVPLYISVALSTVLVGLTVWGLAVNARFSEAMDKDNSFAGFASNGFQHSVQPLANTKTTTFFETAAQEQEAEALAGLDDLDAFDQEENFAQEQQKAYISVCDAGEMGTVFGGNVKAISECSAMIKGILLGEKNYQSLECECLSNVLQAEAKKFDKCKFPASAPTTMYKQWEICNPGFVIGRSKQTGKLVPKSVKQAFKEVTKQAKEHKRKNTEHHHKAAAVKAHKTAAVKAHKTAAAKSHKAESQKKPKLHIAVPVKHVKASVTDAPVVQLDMWSALKNMFTQIDKVFSNVHHSVKELSSNTKAEEAAANIEKEEHNLKKLQKHGSEVVDNLKKLSTELPKGALQQQLFSAANSVEASQHHVLAKQEAALHALDKSISKLAAREGSAVKLETANIDHKLEVAHNQMKDMQNQLADLHHASLDGEIVRELATVGLLLLPALLFPFLLYGAVRKSSCGLKCSSALVYIAMVLCWIGCVSYMSVSVVNADICQELDSMELHPEKYMSAQEAQMVNSCLRNQPLTKAFHINHKFEAAKLTFPAVLTQTLPTGELSVAAQLAKKAGSVKAAAAEAKESEMSIEQFQRMLEGAHKSFTSSIHNAVEPLAQANQILSTTSCGEVPAAYFQLKGIVCGEVLASAGTLAIQFAASGFVLFLLGILVPLAATRNSILSDKDTMYTHDVEPFLP